MPSTVPIRFVAGSRKLLEVPRRLHTISCGLTDLVAGTLPDLPAAEDGVEGYRILSAPESAVATIRARYPDHVLGGLHSYRRYYIDMAGSYEAYLARFSSKTRSTLGRKRQRLAAQCGGAIDMREYRSPAELEQFLAAALPLSRLTYQARLLDAGLPETPEARAEMMRLADAGRLRAYLLFIADRPVSYLYLPVDRGVIIYAFLGYDPDCAALSPGTVLQLAALERLFGEGGYRYFDFTEGEGAHKKLFGTHSAAASSFLLLRGSLTNRLLLKSLDMFDGGVATMRDLAERSGGAAHIRRMLRR